MVPSGFMANDPPPAACPVSVVPTTDPSVPAVTPPAGLPICIVESCAPPAHPPPPRLWIRLFQLAAVGSQISNPMPAEVDGAPAGPDCPGPTFSLTRHRSAAAVGGVGPVVAPSAIGSPCLNACTSSTVVLSSGLNAVFMESSQRSTAASTGG